MGFFDKLNAKIELFKLEQRYTKRSRRTTFICDAYYINGEYVYGPSMTQKEFPNVKVFEVGSGKENRRRSVFGMS